MKSNLCASRRDDGGWTIEPVLVLNFFFFRIRVPTYLKNNEICSKELLTTVVCEF